MTGIRTHYDNLQVARNARIEVIKAAYRGLTQRYHPDRNPNDRERCERIMKIINVAFEILSDPEKRAAHDVWIARQEAEAQSIPAQQNGSSTAWKEAPARDYKQEALNRAWQEVYSRYSILNIQSDDADEMAIASHWVGMQLLINEGKDEEHALRLSAAHVARRFAKLPAAVSNIDELQEEWHEPEGKTFEDVGTEMLSKYPIFLDDDVASNAVIGLHHKYVANGMRENTAWRMGYEKVGSRFSILQSIEAEQTSRPHESSNAESGRASIDSDRVTANPWRRFFARYVDMFVFLSIGYFMVGFSTSLIDKAFFNPVGMEVRINAVEQAAISIAIAVLIEAVVVHLQRPNRGSRPRFMCSTQRRRPSEI